MYDILLRELHKNKPRTALLEDIKPGEWFNYWSNLYQKRDDGTVWEWCFDLHNYRWVAMDRTSIHLGGRQDFLICSGPKPSEIPDEYRKYYYFTNNQSD